MTPKRLREFEKTIGLITDAGPSTEEKPTDERHRIAAAMLQACTRQPPSAAEVEQFVRESSFALVLVDVELWEGHAAAARELKDLARAALFEGFAVGARQVREGLDWREAKAKAADRRGDRHLARRLRAANAEGMKQTAAARARARLWCAFGAPPASEVRDRDASLDPKSENPG